MNNCALVFSDKGSFDPKTAYKEEYKCKPKKRVGAAKQGVMHGPWMYNGELGTTYQNGGPAYPPAQYCHGDSRASNT